MLGPIISYHSLISRLGHGSALKKESLISLPHSYLPSLAAKSIVLVANGMVLLPCSGPEGMEPLA